MSAAFLGSLGFLWVIPVLVAEWIGVIALARAGKSGAWWTMLVGLVLTSLGYLLQTVGVAMMAGELLGSGGGYGFGGGNGFMIAVVISTGTVGLGGLVFAVGFALHGLRASRIGQRVEELEGVLAAQGEELARYQARG